MLKETNFSKVAEKYNVSDNAVRKWCKQYGLSDKSKDYK
jgi:transposase-like protein